VIIEFVIVGFIGLVQTGLLGVLPLDESPASYTTEVQGWIHWYSFINAVVPLSEALELALISVEVLAVMGGVYALVWLLRKLPFVGVS